MKRQLTVKVESFLIDGVFNISRGAKTHAEVIYCEITEDGVTGRGESVPYKRYGETIDSVINSIKIVSEAVESGLSRIELQSVMPAGAARNAVDCALWDLELKLSNTPAEKRLGLNGTGTLTTAYTLSLGEAEAMYQAAVKNAHRPLLKIKTGTRDDAERLRAVRRGAPNSKIIVDANEGWREDNLAYHLQIAKECDVALIEQPLPAGSDEMLAHIDHLVPLCADESVHLANDLEALKDRYDAINIKLDKTGGLTEALTMKAKAQELGFQIMVGCMVGTSLGMAPAIFLAQGVDYVDLDGPLLLAKDRSPSLRYSESIVYPPTSELWG